MKKLLVLAVALGLASSVSAAVTKEVQHKHHVKKHHMEKHHAKKHHQMMTAMPMEDKTYDHWFVGISTNYSVGITEKIGNPSTSEASLGSSDLGWGVLVGKRITKYFGAEANFQYMGNREYNLNTAGTITPYVTFKDGYQLNVNGIGYLPALNQYVDFFVRAGVGYQFGAKSYDGMTGAKIGELDTFLINFGGGVQFNFNPVSIRLAYQAQRHTDFQVDNGSFTGAGNLAASTDYLTLDLLYDFC